MYSESETSRTECTQSQKQVEQYQAVVNQISYESNQKDAVIADKERQIFNLTAQLTKATAEKWENPRTFDMQSDGTVYSIESNNHRKFVGVFRIENVESFSSTVKGIRRDYLKVSYCGGLNIHDTAVIPAEKIAAGSLVTYFMVFQRRCSKNLANEFLYWMLMQFLNTNMQNIGFIDYPEFPGAYFSIRNNEVVAAEYVCCDHHVDETVRPYLSEVFLNKKLPRTDKTFTKLMEEVRPYLSSHAAYVLLAFSLAGLLSTYLKLHHNALPVILTVSAGNTDSEVLADTLLRTYERYKPPKSLTISKTELVAQLRANLDETIVLRDDTTSESNVKRISALDIILGIQSDEKYKPHNIAILSRNIHHFIPVGKALPLELDENFGRGISEAERCRLQDSLSEMHRYFIDEFCRGIADHGRKLNAMIDALQSEENGFNSESSKKTFSVLYAVLMLWAEIFHAQLPDDFKLYLVRLVAEAQNRETGKELAVVNDFFSQLNHAVSSGVLDIVELGRDMAFRENQNIVIHDGELMLMEEATVRNVFLPNTTAAATVSGILSALSAEGYLVSTNGHRKPTTVYNENGTPKQMKLIAFRFREMVNSNLLEYIESQKTRQYFSSKLPETRFIPLIHNAFGRTAGQLLKDESNQHRFVTGMSGKGKTVFLILLLYHLSLAGNRVVVFDADSSFTKSKLLKVLPEEFVREHVTFHSVEQDGLPVNLFHTYPEDKPRVRWKILSSILGEAVHHSSQSQEIALTEIAKRMMHDTESPSYIDLLVQLENAEGTSEISIANKLRTFFEELIDQDDETPDDWFTFLDRCRDVVIISMEDAMGENGSQLMDMLLVSLYYAQSHEEEPRQLSIFIDEIHNQHLSDKSIISRILRQGRKLGIDLNFSTQYVTEMKQNRMMKQAGISVYFRPDLDSRASVASMLGLKKNEICQLDKLEPGECFIQGTVYNFETGYPEEAVIIGKTCILADSTDNTGK